MFVGGKRNRRRLGNISEILCSGDDMAAFEEQMRKQAPSWSAFDIRMMFQVLMKQ